MARVQISKGKFNGLQTCANKQGVIAAAAMDQRGSLKKGLEKAGGRPFAAEDLTAFKTKVTKVLTRYASAILLDPEYGLPALEERAPGSGVLLAYEKTGYDTSVKGRFPDLLDHWSVRRLSEAGANAVKILMYYNPHDDASINEVKHAFIERVGSECVALDIPFFLEPVTYDDNYDEKGLEYAQLKPEYVAATMEEFSKDRYGVDILKVEIPINLAYLRGSRAYKGGDYAYDHETALEHFRAAASVAKKPFIYLSAGVDNEVFLESLELAIESGVPFSGVLCGRATWKEGIPVFAKNGPAALEEWLLDQGVKNIQALNEILAKGAHAWYSFYGGLDNIEVVG
ncbi:MAG: tagatose 1,6-diphosphate aldolase [Ktedonobacteraceae bacterium]|nr:tagatose 1,6-diphosphate aldolase [Ktedonobacteraceae bacterium]